MKGHQPWAFKLLGWRIPRCKGSRCFRILTHRNMDTMYPECILHVTDKALTCRRFRWSTRVSISASMVACTTVQCLQLRHQRILSVLLSHKPQLARAAHLKIPRPALERRRTNASLAQNRLARCNSNAEEIWSAIVCSTVLRTSFVLSKVADMSEDFIAWISFETI